MERWATFDCYGTLVDWNAGIGAQLERLLGGDRARLLGRYHEVEPQVQARDPSKPYRQVMAAVLEEIARTNGVELADEDRDERGGKRDDGARERRVCGSLHFAVDACEVS